MRGRIFISYRRDDSPGDARSIRDRLARRFGDASVFMDIDNLMAGQRFDQELEKALAQCEVLVAVMGARWMELLAQHRRAGGRDYVREEIAAALSREIAVIPVLVGREGRLPALPRADELPRELRNLVLYQKHALAHESFSRDAGELAEAIGKILRGQRTAVPWKGVAVGGLTGVAAATALVGVLVGGVLLLRSGSSGSSADNSPVFKTASRDIDASAKKARDEESKRYFGESPQSVLDQGAKDRCDYYERQAAVGDVGSMIRLAQCYEDGTGVPKNLPQAIVWYQRAADAGNDSAKAKLKKLKGG